MDRRYKGEQADILYNLRRCIHAEECIHRLSQVFDSSKRPWIDANGADADYVTRVIQHCPSGALHVERHDGGAGEPTPERNTIRLHENGYLQFTGDLAIHSAVLNEPNETRAALCRCGASNNKPFCDNSHLSTGFAAPDPTPIFESPSSEMRGGKLTITPDENGPFHVEGNMEIYNAVGALIFAGDDAWLCRCAGSGDKPFCDSTHERIGFQAAG
jgi:CDGSH-type Zn-finger protein/uncharacterized Fe-S cluster protein YjdI